MSAEKKVSPVDPAGQSGGVDLDLSKNHLDQMGEMTTKMSVQSLKMSPAKAQTPPANPMKQNELMNY